MFGLQGSGSRRVSVPHRTSVNVAGLTLARLQGMGYSIGQVSRKTGLSEHTLRYYDGQGLLPGIA